MKYIYVLCLIVLASVYAKETYTTENDNLDIEALIRDVPALEEFVGCFLDTVECNPVAADFKNDIKEAVEQLCEKCTDAQKHIFKRFLEGLKEKLPAKYEAFKKKYDADGNHFPALEAVIADF
uniref:Chemosensory protein n=1 Tax=Antheraea yamamai TaxID=7121 RepID=E3UPD1_ANTYA|nr:chemosensory protein [Antheraea yamamai]